MVGEVSGVAAGGDVLACGCLGVDCDVTAGSQIASVGECAVLEPGDFLEAGGEV